MSEVAVRLLRGPRRLLRWAVLGGSSLGLASAAHLLGGGTLPGAAVLVVAAGLIGLVALTVTARRVRLPVMLAVLAVEQLLLHCLFDLTSTMGSSACVASVHPADHLALGAHPLLTCPVVPAPGGQAMGASSAASGWLMLAGHVLATLATAWLLARGEAWLWRLADRVVAAARVGLTARARRARSRLGISGPVPARTRLRHDPGSPRGPPPASSVLILS